MKVRFINEKESLSPWAYASSFEQEEHCINIAASNLLGAAFEYVKQSGIEKNEIISIKEIIQHLTPDAEANDLREKLQSDINRYKVSLVDVKNLQRMS